MKLIDDALDPVIAFYKAEEDFQTFEGSDYRTGSSNRTINLRLDAEIESGMAEVGLDILSSQAKFELLDILKYGDRDAVSDPFRKAIDGSEKLGKKLKTFEINHAKLYSEFKPTKDAIEYTLYVVIYVEWED